jgi:hypothetical protein
MLSAAPLILASMAFTRDAAALDFTPEGTLVFAQGAAFTEGFETMGSQPGFAVRESPDALEGKNIGFVNSQSFDQVLTLPLTLPSKDAAYQARMFVRKNRVIASIEFDGGTLAEVNALFYPTGRVTSDGWYEIATAPFTVQVTKGAKATVSIFASGAEIDGFEVVEVGPPRELRACSGSNDPVCGSGEFCAARTCHDGALGLPPLPIAEVRASVADYLKARLSLFFGGRYTREITLPAALATIDGIKTAQNAWEFWNGFATAVRQLRDWHTRMDAAVTVAGRGALPVCFVEGDADLSHATAPSVSGYPDVLVSHVGPDQNFNLKPGDRLVAVNGVHPILFMESLEDVNWDTWRANDPQTHAEKLENIRKAIRRWATEFTIVRCDPVSKTCSAPETFPVSALSDTEPNIYPTCDHRPGYHLAEGNPDPVTHEGGGMYYGPLAATDTSEALYGMIWDDVYLDGSSSNPYQAPIETFRTKAKGLILDHRTGNGGTELAAEYLTELFRTPADLGASTGFNVTIGLLGGTTSQKDSLAILNERQNSDDQFLVGSDTARLNLRTALLLARDGSASDWFPLGMRGASPNVRLFGRRTAGAFSSYLSFDYYGQMSFRLASGDFIANDGNTHLGYGVQPDEDILPKQSDLLVGRDTVYERALAWVRTGK